MPAILLVPTALSAMGTQLYKSVELRDTTANTKFPAPHANPHQGKGGFRIEVSRYLSNALYTGNSAKAWYLLADPNDLPVIEMAFLNGQEAPTVETSDADFNMLGIRMRGYHDFPPTASTCRTHAAACLRTARSIIRTTRNTLREVGSLFRAAWGVILAAWSVFHLIRNLL